MFQETSSIPTLNTTKESLLQNRTHINLVEKMSLSLNETILNTTNPKTQLVEFDEVKFTTTLEKSSTELPSTSTVAITNLSSKESTAFDQDIQGKSSTESTTTTIITTQIIDVTSPPKVDPTSIETNKIEPLTIPIESTTISSKIEENNIPETTTIENFFDINTDNESTSTISLITTTPLISLETEKLSQQKRFLFHKN